MRWCLPAWTVVERENSSILRNRPESFHFLLGMSYRVVAVDENELKHAPMKLLQRLRCPPFDELKVLGDFLLGKELTVMRWPCINAGDFRAFNPNDGAQHVQGAESGTHAKFKNLLRANHGDERLHEFTRLDSGDKARLENHLHFEGKEMAC